MKRGFFSRFSRTESTAGTDPAAEPVPPAPEPVPEKVAEIVRAIAARELPATPRKAAISLRLDAEVLDWFKAQGPGYQTRINSILRAYKDAAG